MNINKPILLAAGLQLAALSHASSDFSACQENFFQGKAPVPSANQPGKQQSLCFDSFAVLYSGESKTPIYSAEFLTKERLLAAKSEQRTNRFYEEARIPSSGRALLNDYHKSGFDRGHQSPAGDMPNENAMAQSFSLANIVPQSPQNNRGVWAKNVEKPTRQYAMRSTHGIYVMTGPIYRGNLRTIGAGNVWVPNALFKLVFDPARKKAWAYVVENTDDAQVTGVLNYQDLVKMTGMQFLPAGAVNAK